MGFRKIFFSILTIVFGAGIVVALFMPLVQLVESSGAGSIEFGLLDSFDEVNVRFLALNDEFQPAFGRLLSIATIIAVVLYGLFAICFILQALNVGINFRPLLKAIAITMLLVGIFIIVCALIFILSNRVIFNEKIILSFRFGLGIYLAGFGAFVAGILGIIAQN